MRVLGRGRDHHRVAEHGRGDPAQRLRAGAAADQQHAFASVRRGEEALIGDQVQRRLVRLAEELGREPVVATL